MSDLKKGRSFRASHSFFVALSSRSVWSGSGGGGW